MLDQIRKMILRVCNYFSLRRELLVTLLIFLAWYSLNLDGGLFNDEVVYASAGQSIIHGGFYVNMEHPPLGKYFMGLGEMAIGDTSLGARASSVIFAVATLLLVYEIMLILTRNKWLSISCTVILGTTSQFYNLATMAMLDIYLTFFSTLLLYLCIRLFRSDGLIDDHQLFYIGMVSACVFASKYYGLYFVVVAYIFAVVLDKGFQWTDASRNNIASIASQVLSRMIGRRSKSFCIGFLMVSLIIFAPYLLRPQSLLESLILNYNKISEGYIIMVAGTPYQFPPIWSYLYWMMDIWGRRIALPIFISMLGIFLLIRKKPDFVLLFMGCYFLIPLMALSLMTVKIDRYIFPLLPIAIVLIVLFFGFLIDKQTEWISKSSQKSHIRILAIGSAVILIIMAANLVGIAQKPRINYDSEFDGAADKIISIYDKEKRDSLVILGNRLCLMYYLEPKMAKRNISVYNLKYSGPQDDQTLDLLKSGIINYVVDTEHPQVFTNKDVYQYVRQDYLEKIQIRRLRFLWRMTPL